MELIRDFAAMIRSEVDVSIVNLENAIRTMAGLPGRKAILYISNGLPHAAGGGSVPGGRGAIQRFARAVAWRPQVALRRRRP